MPGSLGGFRHRHRLLTIIIIGLLLFCLITLFKPSQADPVANFDDLALDFYFKQLHSPGVGPTNTSFSPDHGFSYELSGDPIWTQSLKKRLCIIDFHNGTFSEAGEALAPDGMSWQKYVASRYEGISLGMLNHWIYSKIHGYKYYHVQNEELHDRRMSWLKPKVLHKILQRHDVCVYLDTDATFARLDLPLEWLLNYWRLDPSIHAMALATDPPKPASLDERGKLYHNTGFIVLHNTPQTLEILEKWSKCPDEGEPYPQCTRFRNRVYTRLDKERKNLRVQQTDQAGFGNYVRYDYPESIVTLNCTEANGYPLSGTECEGTFIRHFWLGKQNHIKTEVASQAPGRYLELLSAQYRREKEQFWVEEADLGK